MTLSRVARAIGNKVVLRALIWLILAIEIFPIAWMVLTSFKSSDISQAIPPVWNFTPTLGNYQDVLTGNTYTSQPFSQLVEHSVIVTFISTLITIILGTLAAYGLARFRFRGRNFVAMWILSTIMFPPSVAVIPVFLIAGHLSLMDTLPVLVIPYVAFNLPFVIWMLRGYIKQIPYEIEEAAHVDGASRANALYRVVLPLLAPGIAASAILSAILSWNEYLFALALTRTGVKTAPVGVSEFTSMYGTQWGDMTAASVVIAGPILVMVLILRRRFIAGLTFGAVK